MFCNICHIFQFGGRRGTSPTSNMGKSEPSNTGQQDNKMHILI